jgi:hypothetical protein
MLGFQAGRGQILKPCLLQRPGRLVQDLRAIILRRKRPILVSGAQTRQLDGNIKSMSHAAAPPLNGQNEVKCS